MKAEGGGKAKQVDIDEKRMKEETEMKWERRENHDRMAKEF